MRNKLLVPIVMTVCGVLLMAGLGIWQLQRLAWKEELIDTIATANEQAPLSTLPNDITELQDLRFRRVQLSGSYQHDKEVHVAARYYRGQLGYHIFTPLALDDGRTVMVNRGWIPVHDKDDFAARATGEASAPVTIDAMIRTSNERNYFTPPNSPEENVWFGRDVDEIARYHELELIPVTVDLIGSPDVADGYPIPGDGNITLRNDHLGYAITWFGIGLGVLVIGGLYIRQHKRTESDEKA